MLAPRFSWCLIDLTGVWGPTYILKGYTMTRFDNAFIVPTQTMVNENYDTASAHNWKCRGGNTYIVKDVTSQSQAMAFVMSAFSCNTSSDKEFPIPTPRLGNTYADWQKELLEDIEMMADIGESKQKIYNLMFTVYVVSPKTGREKVQIKDFLELDI